MSLQAMALRNRASGAIDDEAGVDSATQQQFLASIKPWAEETAGKLGVAPELVAAHAALESGWGKQPLKNGTASANNLFGVKAGGGWQGEVATASTTEYEHGACCETERFRSYPDTASAFRDYASLLSSNPRYAAALNTGSDARLCRRPGQGRLRHRPAVCGQAGQGGRAAAAQRRPGRHHCDGELAVIGADTGSTVAAPVTRARITVPLALRTRTVSPRAPASSASPAMLTSISRGARQCAPVRRA
jgi:hypothetical protein